MERNIDLPIAVIDSGVGGISVLQRLIEIMPCEDFVYFGDSENAPYGGKSRAEVLELTRKNLLCLQESFGGIKAFVIACNTATSAAAFELREENPDLPIIGIEPAIKPAVSLPGAKKVLVMATPLTLAEEKYRSLSARLSSSCEIVPLPCAGLSELIEKGDMHSEEIRAYLKELFSPYQGERIDAVVLGCTHYPHVRDEIALCLPQGTPILDGGEGTARQTKKRLSELGLLRERESCGSVEILSSSDDGKTVALCRELLRLKGGR